MWNIASMVLTYYCDDIFTVAPLPVGRAIDPDAHARNEFRLFRVTYGDRAHQSMTTDGRWVRAEVSETREVRAGELHTIPVLDYHAPTIPLDVPGATLVFSSPRVRPDGPDVLIGGSAPPATGRRRPISTSDGRCATNQLSAWR
jgi:hypothetical protein